MKKQSSIHTLDSLRGILSFIVMISHYNLHSYWHTDYRKSENLNYFIKKISDSGVDVFFCLSGFIMTYCYKKKFLNAFNEGKKQN